MVFKYNIYNFWYILLKKVRVGQYLIDPAIEIEQQRKIKFIFFCYFEVPFLGIVINLYIHLKI